MATYLWLDLLVSSYASSITQALALPLQGSLHTRHGTGLVGRLAWSAHQNAKAARNLAAAQTAKAVAPEQALLSTSRIDTPERDPVAKASCSAPESAPPRTTA